LALAEAESFKINHKWKQSKEDWGRCIIHKDPYHDLDKLIS